MDFSKTSDSQKMKPQPPLNLNSVPQFPLNPPTSDQIQKCLDDNKNLILAILECIRLGKFTESAQYQEILQQNLTYLAAMADAQSQQGSATASQLLTSFVQQGNQMQQTQASALKLQQESDPVPKLPFLLNTPRSQDQPLHQFLHLQPQQQFHNQLGFRSAANTGMYQIMRPGVSSLGGMDIQGNKQAGSSDGSWKPGHGGGGGDRN